MGTRWGLDRTYQLTHSMSVLHHRDRVTRESKCLKKTKPTNAKLTKPKAKAKAVPRVIKGGKGAQPSTVVAALV